MATSSASSEHQAQKYSSSSIGSSENEDQLLAHHQNEEQAEVVVEDIRKRKRMLSNRESARRSRQRKQQHLDNLTAQVNQLKTQNGQILASTNTTTHLYLNVEAENSVLRAQLDELSNRLHSLNEIIRCLTAATTTTAAAPATAAGGSTVTSSPDQSEDRESFDHFDLEFDGGFSFSNPWGFSFGNHCPIMPHMDLFMC